MKTRLLYIGTFIFLICCMTSLQAATISVANGSENSEIYVNNRFVGQKELENYVVSEGSYQIKVYENNVKTFSTLLDLKEDDNKYIDLQQYNSYKSNYSSKKVNSTITVFTTNDESEVFLNNNRIARGSITDYVVAPGTYMIEVFDNGEKTFSSIADIKKNESKVFTLAKNTTPQTSTPVTITTPLTAPLVSNQSKSALNIFTDEQDSLIYVDGKRVGKGNVADYTVAKGSHNVTVYHNSLKVFSTIVNVPENEVVAVDATHFVDYKSDMPNIGAKKQELKRMKASRGNIGLGYSLGYTSGVNLRYYFTNRFGIQGNYVGAKTNRTDSFNNWNANAIFVLKDTIINGRPASLYLTAGYGGKNKIYDDGNSEKHIDTVEVNLGVEIPIFKNNAYLTYEVGYLKAKGETNEYTQYSTWYGSNYYFQETDTDYSGIGMRAGISYFF